MKHTILGVRIDDVSIEELQLMLKDWLHSHASKIIVTTNAEFLVSARTNKIFQERLNQSDLSLPDSVGIRFAVAALTDEKLQHRHPGIDVLDSLAQICESESKTLVLLGGNPGVAHLAAQEFRRRYEHLSVHSVDPGVLRFCNEEIVIPEELIDRLKQRKPDVIAVALGAGKQEAFIFQARIKIPEVKIWIGVGGALDMISGIIPRAPQWMQRVGLEWLWRLGRQPKRFRRIVNAVFIFPFIITYNTLLMRRFFKAVVRVVPEIVKQLFF